MARGVPVSADVLTPRSGPGVIRGGVAAVVWSTGKRAEVVTVEGERITLRSEAAYAPGAPVTGALEGHAEQSITVKVHGCRREGDAFVITGRLVNLTRAVRDLLV